MSTYCAVQLRVPVRVTVLSNSTAAAAAAATIAPGDIQQLLCGATLHNQLNSRFLPLKRENRSHCQTLSFLLAANRIPERQRCISRQSLPLSTQSVWSFKSLIMYRARTALLRPFKDLLSHLPVPQQNDLVDHFLAPPCSFPRPFSHG